ncbi:MULTISPECIES: HAD family hydrolase [Yersinia]|uniref:HAD phosphoserine phosphatase-like hydrolase, IB family protein n=1 Tax=Yersinia rochesterensis TaxID=1604335 RepID=A0A8D4SSQ0_9GAMM|nr:MULTISPECIES: HAD family hydrolase [Yersinia]AJI88414.1 HAD phosphoserine phosphatase-like hydrolase, IB family protein [Yersinia frederiksenii Y225]CRY61042.1 putative hydrolase [Yersinia kristensenii]AIN16657.1 HAD phosphoserine phosphatase-like hydrolase, IB family protein [Yersinia rochesterensis]AJJ36403.1 HAD phosphoserine phosphatase-like hydrolase, IB family protein [Yersinia rochesterensis]AYD44540.1 HAD-IB family hydrolase [Yersinia rochesterensis]
MDLALFDLDETLISDDSSGLWMRWLVDEGLASHELAEQEQYLMKQYYQGNLSMSCYMESTLSPLVGKHTVEVAGWVERFIARDILPRIYPQARKLLAWHRDRGDYIVIISATGEHLVNPIAQCFSANAALAIGVAVEDNRYTGKTYGTLTYREGKVERLKQWLTESPQLDFQRTYGYSDSINDKPLLEYVDRAAVINPGTELVDLAILHDWDIHHWQRR